MCNNFPQLKTIWRPPEERPGTVTVLTYTADLRKISITIMAVYADDPAILAPAKNSVKSFGKQVKAPNKFNTV